MAGLVLGWSGATSTESPAMWIAPSSRLASTAPCPIFRSEFTLNEQPIHGTVEVVGLGHYELRLNGRIVGESLINQPWSEYSRRIYFQSFDVSDLVRTGKNAWGVTLGNSFWSVGPVNDPGRFSKTDAMPDFSLGRPYLLMLRATFDFEDGSSVVVSSDGSWKWTDGPLRFSHIYAGEDFDARQIQEGWDRPGFDDRSWKPVQRTPPPVAVIAPLYAPPIRAFERFNKPEIRKLDDRNFTYIFPQNCSALLRFRIKGAPGQTVRFRPCEYMLPDGHVKFTYLWGTGKDIWHDYTVGSKGAEDHQILFCYVGCQFVQVTGAVPAGAPNPLKLPVLESLELVHVRAANQQAGEFRCSSDLQNGAFRLIDWAIRSNMNWVATDCPHREKNGWQEQSWHMARSVSYRFDTHDWASKICSDMQDTQLIDGHVPTNCPNYLVGVPPHGFWNEAPEWGIAAVLLPWHLYEWYGDRRGLQNSFWSMSRYVDYLGSTAQDGLIRSNLGDWYDYGHGKGDGESQWTPTEVSATAIWALGAKTVADAAQVLGKSKEAAQYRKLYETIRATFQAKLFDPKTAMVKNNGSCQSGNATALCVGLIPENLRNRAVQAIIDDLATRGYQQTTGEVLHVFLIRALAEAGRSDVLHKVYARTERGSYGFMVNSGRTTLPESWGAQQGTGNSMNHYMLGQLMEWQFGWVAGIRQAPGSIGWQHVIIGPNPGQLTSAEADFRSPLGRISSKWVVRDGRMNLVATVPEGVEASALLPNGETRPLRAGVNRLEIRMAVR